MPRENVWTEEEIEAGFAEFNRLFDGLCRTAPLDARIRIVDVGFPCFAEGSMMELVSDQTAPTHTRSGDVSHHISAEMMEAGLAELYKFDPEWGRDDEETVVAIFRAMQRVAL